MVAFRPFILRRGAALVIMSSVRTVGVEEELLVVDAAGMPVPKGPEALEVASVAR